MKIVSYKQPRFQKQLNKLTSRFELSEAPVEKVVKSILADVRKTGDRAVMKYTKKFDGLSLKKGAFCISREQIKQACQTADPKVVKSLKLAADRITSFHQRQKTESWSYKEGGVTLGQMVQPMDRVGLYVPGGKAAYPSSLLMNAIPALVAGVKEVVV
ncbi:MAG: histidinol dehydrogenase, partial [Nitrospirae bacterium]|nr:histidinol dehydrogenase [Nitrospirota bacterium]